MKYTGGSISNTSLGQFEVYPWVNLMRLCKLKIPGQLRVSLSTTNPIESAIGTARDLTGRVKRWRNGTQVLRWLSCGFMECEKKFRKIKGYKLMPVLINILSGNSDDQALTAG